jgi:hypothetical protein
MKSLDADLVQRTSSSNAGDQVMRLAIAAEALRCGLVTRATTSSVRGSSPIG